MKISLCNPVLSGRPVAAQADFAAALGYDGLEIAPFTLSDEPHRLPAAERGEIRRAVADAGLAVTALHFVLMAPEGLSITSTDPDVAARTRAVMAALPDLAADLGAGVCVHGSPKQRALEPGREEAGRAAAKEAIAVAAEAAARAGVLWCLEPLAREDTGYVNTLDEALGIVEEIASPGLATMIDTCAAGRAEAEDVPTLLERHLPSGRIAHVHFNDPNRRGPGEGEMAFAPILSALWRHGYAGNVGVEPFVHVPDGPATAARCIGYLRGIEEALR